MKEDSLTRIVGLAVNDYGMIQADDVIVLGISGGMDSVALVCLLHARLRRLPIKYNLHPVMIDLYGGRSEEHTAKIGALSEFLRGKTGLSLDVIRLPVIDYLVDESGAPKVKNTCFKCAQIRRAELIKYADAKGFKKIAFGHHKDDIVETILLNLFYKRETSAMMPRLPLFDGKF
jgi:tRNA 2-thiocytidine biosynthesis protein TtcA